MSLLMGNERIEEILKNPVSTKGVSLDVTRRLRIEGHNPSLVGGNVWHDIWEGGATKIPEPSSAGERVQIQSTSASDTLFGIGGRKVRVEYLNSLNQLLFEDINLSGTTPVLSVATNITDIIDFYNVEVGSNYVSVGTIDLTKLSTPAVIYSRISIGGNKSLSTLRHLLPTSTFYITEMTISGNTKGTDVMLRSNSNDSGDVFGDNNWLFQVPVTLSDAPATIRFDPAIVIPPTGRVKVSARGSNAGNSVSVFINGWVKV